VVASQTTCMRKCIVCNHNGRPVLATTGAECQRLPMAIAVGSHTGRANDELRIELFALII